MNPAVLLPEKVSQRKKLEVSTGCLPKYMSFLVSLTKMFLKNCLYIRFYFTVLVSYADTEKSIPD